MVYVGTGVQEGLGGTNLLLGRPSALLLEHRVRTEEPAGRESRPGSHNTDLSSLSVRGFVYHSALGRARKLGAGRVLGVNLVQLPQEQTPFAIPIYSHGALPVYPSDMGLIAS